VSADAKLTVLLPVKRFHREYLGRAVASLFAQTSRAWRLVVVHERRMRGLDDALASAIGDERVRLVRNEGRRLAGAINTGMRHADTPFTAILLGDDLWAPRAVEVLTGHIERFPDVDFFHSARMVVDAHDRPLSSVHPARESFALEEFLDRSPVKHLLCWRRSLALELGGLDESLRSVGPDDYDFPWTMAEGGARFMAVQDCLYLYRDHRDAFRLTTHLPRSRHLGELERILRKHGVGEEQIGRALARAQELYLRQCLYRTPADRLWKTVLRVDPRKGWRETYR
jgi:glycosyltransferase involved in cell wall biosynthesis